MNLRKCKDGEIKKIIQVANRAFVKERSKGFTFVDVVPQIYNNPNCDYSSSHFVVENEKGKFVAVGGNLIDDIIIGRKKFKFSRVGTIGTIPTCRGRGYMKQIMYAIDDENKKQKVVFSILSGKRNRYLNYGYDRAGFVCSYVFDKDQARYLKADYDIEVKKFEKSHIDSVYEIYTQNQKFILKSKDNFEYFLNNGGAKLFTVFFEEQIIGYFSVKKDAVTEINFIDNKFLKSVLAFILNSEKIIDYSLNKHKEKTFQVKANILNKEMCKQLDKISNHKILTDIMSIKIYNFEKFVEMLFLLNFNKSQNISETYKIGIDNYNFAFENGKFKLSKTDESCLQKFETQSDFVRFALGNDFSDVKSQIFPIVFDLNKSDKF